MPPTRQQLIQLLEHRASIDEPRNVLMVRTNEQRAWAADMLIADGEKIERMEILQNALCEVNAQRATENLQLHREITQLKLNRGELDCVCHSELVTDSERNAHAHHEQQRYLQGFNAGVRLAVDVVRNSPAGISLRQLADALTRMIRTDAEPAAKTDVKAETR